MAFLPSLEGTLTSILPLSLPLGVLSTFVLGILFEYTFQRKNNIIDPWISHASGGIWLNFNWRKVSGSVCS